MHAVSLITMYLYYSLKLIESFLKTVSHPGTGCSKLMTSLVNVSSKFQTSISQICQYFFEKCEKLLLFLIFSTKISVFLVIKS